MDVALATVRLRPLENWVIDKPGPTQCEAGAMSVVKKKKKKKKKRERERRKMKHMALNKNLLNLYSIFSFWKKGYH